MPAASPPEAQIPGTTESDSRVRLAADPATPHGQLAGLVADGSVTVRAALALNPCTPAIGQHRLAADADERVRLLLARKLSSALPSLSAPAQAELRDRTVAILSGLVRDEAVRVRAVIAAALASLPDAPRAAILTLAEDSAIEVSEPVLRLSPLLSAEDLMALLAAPPHHRTATAIACRAGLPECVADMIAAGADSPAIRSLLANQSAAIREATLDALIARAATEPEWHAPLVRRPRLPDQAARALCEIVAGHELRELAGRTDLSVDVVASIRHVLAGQARPGQDAAAVTDEHLVIMARQMDERGELDEASLLACLRAGEGRQAGAMLAVAAGVGLDIVQRATLLRSAKGLMSLVWRAGFSASAAGPVQTALGKIAPAVVLRATRSGEFPLSVEEMGWQLDFLTGNGR